MRGSYLALMIMASNLALADGNIIDKIYHPYVQPTEQELEFRAMLQDQQPDVADHSQLYRLAYGPSLNDRWFAEVYLTGDRSNPQSLDIEAVEVELKWQLTEQGEY